MKRVLICFFLFLSLGSMTLFADTYKMNFSGGLFYTNYIHGGGFGEFELRLFQNNPVD